MSLPPLPDGLRPSPDPRDAPGTDDHDRLIHPHGDALWYPWPYVIGDLPSYVRSCEIAHRALSADYLVHAAAGEVPPLCRATHGEILVDGVRELPHSMRELVTAALAAIEHTTGKRYGLLRVWRHYGVDCELAEAWRCDKRAHP